MLKKYNSVNSSYCSSDFPSSYPFTVLGQTNKLLFSKEIMK